MTIRSLIPILLVIGLVGLCVSPAQGQRINIGGEESGLDGYDEAAIRDLLRQYENSFNSRDVDWRMSLCLDTYYEYGFENDRFLHVRDYDETSREVGRYWESISSLDYSIDEIEITLDGPLAFVRAYTTHIATNERHSSIVYFSLVKTNGAWRIAWDSYNIVRRYE